MIVQEANTLANTSNFISVNPVVNEIPAVTENAAGKNARSVPDKNTDPNGLTEEEKKVVEKLKKRDREVRRHEQAHLRAAGTLAEGGIKFNFTRGPDGKLYATSGSVTLDTSEAGTPEKTIKKADKIIRAALAPAEPSGEDLQVAAKARRMRMEAMQELRKQKNEESFGTDKSVSSRSQQELIKQAEDIYKAIAGKNTPAVSGEALATV